MDTWLQSFISFVLTVNILSCVGENLVSEPSWSSLDLSLVQIQSSHFGEIPYFPGLVLVPADLGECGLFVSGP